MKTDLRKAEEEKKNGKKRPATRLTPTKWKPEEEQELL